jgi:hypothetical protein
LTTKEQTALVKRYQAMAPKTQKRPLPPQLKLIYSLWGQLARADGVKTDSKQACDTFCEKHLTGGKLADATTAQRSRLIEVLKEWLARVKGDRDDE